MGSMEPQLELDLEPGNRCPALTAETTKQHYTHTSGSRAAVKTPNSTKVCLPGLLRHQD